MLASLRFRLFLTYILIAGIVITIASAAIFIYLLRNPTVDRSELQRLRQGAGLIARRSPIFDLQPGQSPPARLDQAVQRADTVLQARVAVYDANGQLLADSRAGASVPLPDYAIFTRRRLTAISLFRDSAGEAWLFVTAPLDNGNLLVVAAPRPKRSVWNLFREDFLPPFLRATALALILSVILAFWMSHWISRPLQRLSTAARSLSASEFHTIPPEGPVEVQDVARAFNEMGERLQASQRSQRDFVANVSHDLKTPLTSIQGYAQAILDGAADGPTAARVIYDEAGRMHRMVLDLLDLARLDAGTLGFERAPIDLSALLRGVAQKLALQAQRAQVDLRMDPPEVDGGEHLMVTGDADRLAQVFANLVENALKFTPAGGQVQIAAQPSEGWAQVQVADSGPGIPADELGRIFERFYQVDKSRRGGERRGVGLGLAIAREIVQAHGGSIQAANRSDGESGSVFTVRLPLLQPDDNSLAPRRSRTAPRTV